MTKTCPGEDPEKTKTSPLQKPRNLYNFASPKYRKIFVVKTPKNISPIKALKLSLTVAAYGYLLYRLITFDGYHAFAQYFGQLPATHYTWLLVVTLFILVNIGIEARKWQLLTRHIKRLQFGQSLRSVISGFMGAIVTPNRLGEFPARALNFDHRQRLGAVAMGAIGGMMQTLVILACGIPAGMLFFAENTCDIFISNNIYSIFASIFLILLVIILLLPTTSNKLVDKVQNKYIRSLFESLAQWELIAFVRVLLYSFARYAVFCFQLWMMLRFFGISLSLSAGLMSIPTYYLLVTCTPYLSFSEPVVRSSWAIVILGAASQNQEIGLTGAVTILWLMNNVLPMILTNSVDYFRKKKNNGTLISSNLQENNEAETAR